MAAAIADAARGRPVARPDWLYPVLAAALLALLGWMALSLHDMNARIGVVETRLVGVERRLANVETELTSIKSGLAEARAERAALAERLEEVLRRLPPAG